MNGNNHSMIRTSNLRKIYTTEEVETTALDKVNRRNKREGICRYNGTFRMRQVYFTEHIRAA